MGKYFISFIIYSFCKLLVFGCKMAVSTQSCDIRLNKWIFAVLYDIRLDIWFLWCESNSSFLIVIVCVCVCRVRCVQEYKLAADGRSCLLLADHCEGPKCPRHDTRFNDTLFSEMLRGYNNKSQQVNLGQVFQMTFRWVLLGFCLFVCF